jgi:hypothetical protein
VVEVVRHDHMYAIRTDDGDWHTVATPPILATGFSRQLWDLK